MRPFACVILLLFVFATSACQTIYFQNGPGEQKQVGDDELYSLFLFGIDTRGPIDLELECSGNDWRTVKTELSALPGLIGLITTPIYTPWSVAWECR